MRSEEALRARGVHKRYGRIVALEEVDLRVEAGECMALVGESGSGKTTLLRTFNRTVVPDEGRIFVGGADLRSIDPIGLRRSIGYVQQEGGLLPHWTVLRNAATVPWLRGDPDAEERGRRALDRVGLDPDLFGDRWPRRLSGGQRQRVAIARAFAHEPSVILLDEPFGALDAITRSELQDAFRSLVDETGITALLVTHDLQEALLLGDRIAVMRRGRIEQVAATDELVHHPGTPYVERLLERARIGGTA